MLRIEIPGYKNLSLKHLVLDYNGTLACNGVPTHDRLPQLLSEIAKSLQIHIVTADTFGKVRQHVQGWPCQLVVLPEKDQDLEKLKYIDQLGADEVAAVGNGRNDRLMLKRAALGIAVVQQEGAANETVMAADIICRDVVEALELFCHPMRIVATLRS